MSDVRWAIGDDAENSGFQTTEAEVHIARGFFGQQSGRRGDLGMHAVGVRHPRNAERERAIVALLRDPIDHRTAGIPETQQLRDLVERLARRIVSRAADRLVAARLADEGAAQFPVAAAAAHICCSQGYLFAATENIQVHGGTGFTWEQPAHLYFRRSRADQVLLGDASVHRERLASLLAW